MRATSEEKRELTNMLIKQRIKGAQGFSEFIQRALSSVENGSWSSSSLKIVLEQAVNDYELQMRRQMK